MLRAGGRARARLRRTPHARRTTTSARCSSTATCTSGTRSQAGDGFKLVDPDGLLAEPEYDLGVIMREDPLDDDLDARVAFLAARTGLDATAIREWGDVERVSTGLLCEKIDLQPVGRRDARGGRPDQRVNAARVASSALLELVPEPGGIVRVLRAARHVGQLHGADARRAARQRVGELARRLDLAVRQRRDELDDALVRVGHEHVDDALGQLAELARNVGSTSGVTAASGRARRRAPRRAAAC